jgi:hypothetical protein
MVMVNIFAIEVGLIGGNISNPSKFNYGISGGSGMFIPMLKFELEFYQLAESTRKGLTTGIKFRPKLGKLAPFMIVGAGTEMEKITFQLSEYDFFTFIGGGIHYFAIRNLSLRLDVRFLNFSAANRTRLEAGIFFHL